MLLLDSSEPLLPAMRTANGWCPTRENGFIRHNACSLERIFLSSNILHTIFILSPFKRPFLASHTPRPTCFPVGGVGAGTSTSTEGSNIQSLKTGQVRQNASGVNNTHHKLHKHKLKKCNSRPKGRFGDYRVCTKKAARPLPPLPLSISMKWKTASKMPNMYKTKCKMRLVGTREKRVDHTKIYV